MFWGVAFLFAYENLYGNYFLRFSRLMREILHAWRDFFNWCGRFYMLGGRAREIVSRRETPSQCGRVGSPVLRGLRGHNWMHLVIGHSVTDTNCYLEFKLRYLKNLKLFSIRVKELFEPIVLLFSKAFSWETDLWVTLGDFIVKTQNLEGRSALNSKSTKYTRNVVCGR